MNPLLSKLDMPSQQLDWAAAGAKDSPRHEWARQMAEVAWVEERGIVSEEEAEALAEQERAAGRGPRPRL